MTLNCLVALELFGDTKLFSGTKLLGDSKLFSDTRLFSGTKLFSGTSVELECSLIQCSLLCGVYHFPAESFLCYFWVFLGIPFWNTISTVALEN